MAERRLQLSLILLAGWLAGCAAGPGSGIPSGRAPETGGVEAPDSGRMMHPASVSLLEQAGRQRRAGNLSQAAATLERAVRIDPGEPALWLELGRIRYSEANWRQAEQMGRKARSLALPGSTVADAAAALVADAIDRQARRD